MVRTKQSAKKSTGGPATEKSLDAMAKNAIVEPDLEILTDALEENLGLDELKAKAKAKKDYAHQEVSPNSYSQVIQTN
jgi:hypothetical protein